MDISLKKQPNENVDLHFKLASDGTTSNQSQTVTAIVRDGAGTALTGSPFTLVHEANGRYVLRSAFTLGDEGIYSVDFNVANIRWEGGLWVIDCKYEEIGGVGASGGVDPVALGNLIDEIPRKVWRFDTSSIKNEKTAIRQILDKLGFKMPEIDNSPILNAIERVSNKIVIPDNSSVVSSIGGIETKLTQISDLLLGLDTIKNQITMFEKTKKDINKQQDIKFKSIQTDIKDLNDISFKRIQEITNKIDINSKTAVTKQELTIFSDSLKQIKSNLEVVTKQEESIKLTKELEFTKMVNSLSSIKEEINKIVQEKEKIGNNQKQDFSNIQASINSLDKKNFNRLEHILKVIIEKFSKVEPPKFKINLSNNDNKFNK